MATEFPASSGACGARQEALPMRRTKLWELDHRFHCLIIGTCLTIDELRRLARKAGIGVDAKMSDYELHHSFVQVAGNPVFAAKLSHKWLDQKFETVIKRSSACRDAGTLGSLWDQAVTAGDVAGAFWALVTHPFADAELMQRVYGEIHMLSHIAGHSNRSTQQQLAVVRRRVAELEETQAWTAEAARLRIKELERRSEALAERAQRVDALERELATTRTRLAALESGEAIAQLRAQKESLAVEIERSLRRAEKTEREARQWTALNRFPGTRAAPDIQSAVIVEPCPPQCDALEAGDCPGPDLCGRRILYVGGRERQAAHFRAFVERLNGEFLHHDGGRNESSIRLDAMIRAADAVLCPVECVSHDACRRIKRICKRTAKRFVLLRSASLACFVEGLQEVAA